MKIVKRLLLLIIIPITAAVIFLVLAPVDLLAFPVYYITTGKLYSANYNPLSLSVIDWVFCGKCKKGKLKWKLWN